MGEILLKFFNMVFESFFLVLDEIFLNIFELLHILSLIICKVLYLTVAVPLKMVTFLINFCNLFFHVFKILPHLFQVSLKILLLFQFLDFILIKHLKTLVLKLQFFLVSSVVFVYFFNLLLQNIRIMVKLLLQIDKFGVEMLHIFVYILPAKVRNLSF